VEEGRGQQGQGVFLDPLLQVELQGDYRSPFLKLKINRRRRRRRF
jgi:hypothetical protein